jgi:hypothetical protein
LGEIPPKKYKKRKFMLKKRHNEFQPHNFLFPIRGFHSKGKRAQGIIKKEKSGLLSMSPLLTCHFI